MSMSICVPFLLHRWVVDVQFLGHYPNVVDVVLLVVVANPYNLDVTANIANGDVGPNGYVHAIAIFDVVDLDVDHIATFDLVDVLLVVYLLVVAVYFATLFDFVVVVVDVLRPFSALDVLNPFHPFDVVDVRFRANLFVPAHLDVLIVVDERFPYEFP